MPVQTKNNVKYLQFGYGDIYVGEAKDLTTGLTHGAAFVLSEPQEIGSTREELVGESLDKVDTQVIMQFDDIKSLDVVIQTLEEIREVMLRENVY